MFNCIIFKKVIFIFILGNVWWFFEVFGIGLDEMEELEWELESFDIGEKGIVKFVELIVLL